MYPIAEERAVFSPEQARVSKPSEMGLNDRVETGSEDQQMRTIESHNVSKQYSNLQ